MNSVLCCVELLLDATNSLKQTLRLRRRDLILGERKIFIPFVWMDDHKSEIFWHIASIEKKDDRLPILPCTNDRASTICKENCIEGEWLIYPRGEERAHVYSVQCELSG